MKQTNSSRKPLKKIVIGIWIVVTIVACAVIGLFVFKLSPFGSGVFPSLPDQSKSPLVNNPAKDFELENINGKKIKLSDYRGHVVVMNYWATWCGPCIREMPLFQKFFDQYSPGLVVFGIDNQETVEEIRPYVDQLGITYEVLLDKDAKVHVDYQVYGLPTTIIVDENGIVKVNHIGIMTEKQLEAYLRELGVIE